MQRGTSSFPSPEEDRPRSLPPASLRCVQRGELPPVSKGLGREGSAVLGTTHAVSTVSTAYVLGWNTRAVLERLPGWTTACPRRGFFPGHMFPILRISARRTQFFAAEAAEAAAEAAAFRRQPGPI